MAETAVQPMYDKVKSAIDSIDEKLDSLQDSEGATRTKVVNELVEENQEITAQGIDQTIVQLRNLEPTQLVGVVNGIIKSLNAAFKDDMEKTVAELVAAAPKVEPLITEEEAEVLSKQRSELYQQIKQIVFLAETMDGVELPMPKARRGAIGKRGQRAMSKMIWAVDGNILDPQPKYKELAEMLGFTETKGEKTNRETKEKEEITISPSTNLTKFLKDKGVDTKNPKDGKVSVAVPDGRVLSGFIPGVEDTNLPEKPEDDDDDVNEDDDES
jgi:hypothetical protein